MSLARVSKKSQNVLLVTIHLILVKYTSFMELSAWSFLSMTSSFLEKQQTPLEELHGD